MKIAIADDERMARIVLIEMLKELYRDTVEIREARNGKDLLNLIREYQPDIVLVDIKMSELDGLRAISEIRCLSPQTQNIIISGYADFFYAQKAVSLDAVAYLLKPVSPEKLAHEISKAMERLSPGPAPQSAQQSEEVPSDIANIHLYLEKNYADKELSVRSTAEFFMITPNYLSALFHKKYGCCFLDYLASLRIEHAQELLADQSWLNVNEVANRVGFKNARYFSKTFKKLTGFLPSEYAEQFK